MIFEDGDLELDEDKVPPTVDELLFAIRILDKIDGTKLVTDHEELAIAVVSNALVALSDSGNLSQYEMDRVSLRVKVWYESRPA